MTKTRAALCILTLLAVVTFGAAHSQSVTPRPVIVPEEIATRAPVEPFPGMVKIDAAQFVMGARHADGFVFVDELPWPLEEPIPVQTRAFFLDRT